MENKKGVKLKECWHIPCGKRSLIDFAGGIGIKCTWCGCRIESWDEVSRVPMPISKCPEK